MVSKHDDEESEVLKGLFEEILKMISQKQIKVETIVQMSMERGLISEDSLKRMVNMLDQYGKKKQWF